MKFKMILLAICLGLFVFMMTPHIQAGFVVKCGVEQAYAWGGWHPGGHHGGHHGGNYCGDQGGSQGGNHSVPEPSILILLGTGLAAVGSYYGIRLRKR